MRNASPHVSTLMSLACLLACAFAQAQIAQPEEQPPLPKPKAAAQRTGPEEQPRLRSVQPPPVTQAAPVKSDPRYRVELLVFRHLDATEEGLPETTLRDFSKALDLLTPPEPAAEADVTGTAVEPSVPHAAGATPGIDAGLAEGEEPEPPVELVEAQSEAMQHAWRRFRASAGFRPEQFLAWEQSMAKPFPTIRVHDLDVLKEIDPLTGLPVGETRDQANSGQPVEYNDTTKRPYEPAASGKTAGEADAAAVIPQNIRFYRIDGSSRLSRTRFLHLDLDIEFREPQAGTPASPSGADEPAWTVHKLTQSRQVHTNKYEYFDGPNIAVLAFVTRIDTLSAEEQAAEDELVTEAGEAQR